MFLNELKFIKNTALNLRVPLTNDIMPSVMAVKGHKGIVEGIDYRGVSVIAAVLPVPDSPWFMVARMDINEVYAPLRSRLWNVIIVICIVLAGAGTTIGLLWHRQTNRLYRKQLETAESLNKSEEIFNNFMKYSPIYVFFKDENMRAIRLSKNYESMLGKPIPELLGKNMEDIFPSDLAKSMVADDMRILKDGKEIIVDEEFNGRYYTTIKFPIIIDEKTRYLAGFTIDITESKLAEETLTKYKDHLEDMVKERTEELEKAIEEVVSANQAKSIFLSNMSHEMRTPLNAILGFSELMQQDKNIPENYIKWLETINQSGKNLLALINDILEVTKIEAGRISFNKSIFNIHSLLKDIETIFRIKANAKNLNLFTDYANDLPEFIATDEDKLRQIMINLLSNAVKFTKEGTINLRASVINENDKMYFIAEVEDTGPGIAEKDIEKLFQKFGKTETGLNEGGTGLGLAISQQYAKIMNGIITVKSEKGKGTCFTLKIAIEEGKESAKKSD